MYQDLECFGFMKERTMPTPVLLSDLRGFPLSGRRCSMAMRVCRIGTIVCPLSNTRPVSDSAAEATTCLSFWHMVRMGLFVFVVGVLLVGGRSIR